MRFVLVLALALAACHSDPQPAHPEPGEVPPLPPASGTPVGYLIDSSSELNLRDDQLQKLKDIDSSLAAQNADIDVQLRQIEKPEPEEQITPQEQKQGRKRERRNMAPGQSIVTNSDAGKLHQMHADNDKAALKQAWAAARCDAEADREEDPRGSWRRSSGRSEEARQGRRQRRPAAPRHGTVSATPRVPRGVSRWISARAWVYGPAMHTTLLFLVLAAAACSKEGAAARAAATAGRRARAGEERRADRGGKAVGEGHGSQAAQAPRSMRRSPNGRTRPTSRTRTRPPPRRPASRAEHRRSRS